MENKFRRAESKEVIGDKRAADTEALQAKQAPGEPKAVHFGELEKRIIMSDAIKAVARKP